MKNRKRKAPPPPNNPPTPTKKSPQKRGRKRERPNIFMTRDHFVTTSTNEVILKSPDEVKTIQDFRIFLSEEKNRGISFMFNTFKNKNEQTISVPTLFFSNYWQEKAENLKNPLNDNGEREQTAKFKPHDIPAIIEACKLVMKINPHLFKSITNEEKFKADQFISRIRKTLPAATNEADIEELPDLIDNNENVVTN